MENNKGITLVPINELFIDEEFNSRGNFAKVEVADLVRDIENQTSSSPETMGLLNPVTVRLFDEDQQLKYGKKYGLIAGFRRTFAFKAMNRNVIPAIVRENVNDVTATLWNISENVHRKDLNIVQEANALKRLKDLQVPMNDIAKELGVSIGWVQIRFDLLRLPDGIQKEAATGILSQHHIRKLAQVKGNTQQQTVEKQYAAVRLIKDAIGRGIKASDIVVKKDKENALTKRPRKRPEIFEMIKIIAEVLDYNLTTRALGWAAGEVNNIDFHKDIREAAKAKGTDYEIPDFDTQHDGVQIAEPVTG